MPRVAGHRAGVESVRVAVRRCAAMGVKVLTLYAFSRENWARPKAEVSQLMELLAGYLKTERNELMSQNIKLIAIGCPEDLPPNPRNALRETMKLTAGNKGMVLCMALSYSGRHDILLAARKAVQKKLRLNSEKDLSRLLGTHGLPDPDLLIRTGGEMRISNFLLWELAYTEIWVTRTFWPAFRAPHLRNALVAFRSRERRFGLVKPVGQKQKKKTKSSKARGKRKGLTT